MTIEGIDVHSVITDGSQQIEAMANGDFIIGSRFRLRGQEVDVDGLGWEQMLILSACEVVEDRFDRISVSVCKHLVPRMVESGAYFLTVEGSPDLISPPIDFDVLIADMEARFSEKLSKEVDNLLEDVFKKS